MHTIRTSIYWVSDVEHMGSKEQFTACTMIFRCRKTRTACRTDKQTFNTCNLILQDTLDSKSTNIT